MIRSAAAAHAIAALLVVSPSAMARDLYTSPAGPTAAGAQCTPEVPCGIGRAALDAAADDRVLIGPGSYGDEFVPLGFGVGSGAARVTYVGDPAATLHLDNGDPSSFELFDGQALIGNGMTIVSSDEFGLRMHGAARAERVRVRMRNLSIAGTACQLDGGVGATGAQGELVSSECVSVSGTPLNGVGVAAHGNGQTFALRGVTAAASSGGVALAFSNDTANGGSLRSDLTVELSILEGTSAISVTSAADRRACVTTRASAYSGGQATSGCDVVDEGSVFTAPVNVSVSDRHQKPSSQLIDPFGAAPAGITVPASDLDGFPRDAANPDPGAYEWRVTLALTQPAMDLATTTATVRARARVGHGTGRVRFEYGLSTAYGSRTAWQTTAATHALIDRTAALANLEPATTYHVRAMTENGDGTLTTGEDVAFTTASPPVATVPAPAGGSPAAPTEAVVKRCVVPKLTGRTLATARRLLTRAGCAAGKVRRRVRTGGRVRSQTVRAGTALAAGARVGLTIGPKPKPKPRPRAA